LCTLALGKTSERCGRIDVNLNGAIGFDDPRDWTSPNGVSVDRAAVMQELYGIGEYSYYKDVALQRKTHFTLF